MGQWSMVIYPNFFIIFVSLRNVIIAYRLIRIKNGRIFMIQNKIFNIKMGNFKLPIIILIILLQNKTIEILK